MQEMDCVEVIVEKERYTKEGVHKGMQGWICWPECVNGSWLVNFPRCGAKDDIATIGIHEDDMKSVPVMYARINEEIDRYVAQHGAIPTIPVDLAAHPHPHIIILDVNGCQEEGDIHQRLQEAFHFPDSYDRDWYTCWVMLSEPREYTLVKILGATTVPDTLKPTVQKVMELLEENKQDYQRFMQAQSWFDRRFDYEIVN